jgi:hypothetical protein
VAAKFPAYRLEQEEFLTTTFGGQASDYNVKVFDSKLVTHRSLAPNFQFRDDHYISECRESCRRFVLYLHANTTLTTSRHMGTVFSASAAQMMISFG